MKVLRYFSLFMAIIMLAGCSGEKPEAEKKQTEAPKERYELIAEYDGDIDGRFVLSGNRAFYIKTDDSGHKLMKINPDNTEEEISPVIRADDEWVYISDNWLVFYKDNWDVMKYNTETKELSAIVKKDNMYNILLLDNNLFYLNAYGLLCQLNLLDDSVRMIDQSVPADMADGIDSIFADKYNKEDIYYWNSDKVTLMKFSMADGLRYEMYKKGANEELYENFYAADEIVYTWNDNAFKIIKENAVTIDETGSTFVLDEDGISCYKKNGRVTELKNGNETDTIESMPEGYDGEPAFINDGKVWFSQADKFYTVRADNTASEIVEFSGEILGIERTNMYAFGNPSESGKKGIYNINLGIN